MEREGSSNVFDTGYFNQDGEASGAKQSGFLSLANLMWLGGWIFEVGTVAISIVDVVSDGLVALQFYEGGHMLWFWLVVVSIVVSNIIYTFMAHDTLQYRSLEKNDPRIYSWLKDRDRTLCFLIILPFAQIVPIVNWTTVTKRGQREKELTLPSEKRTKSMPKIGSVAPAAARASSAKTSRAAAEELEGMRANAETVRKLRKGFKAHMDSHAMFYVETIAESIPQSIIQLLAITFMGTEPTFTQYFSMSLSLLSIVSKAYSVSQSFDMKMMLFRFALVAHDIFSLFYIFSSVISKSGVKETTVWWLGGVETSYLSQQWMNKLAIFVLYGIFVGLVTMIYVAYDYIKKSRQPYGSFYWTDVRNYFLIAFFVVTLGLPGVFVVEGAKLALINWFLVYNDFQDHQVLPAALTYNFVQQGKSKHDKAERLRAIALEYADAVLGQPNGIGDEDLSACHRKAELRDVLSVRESRLRCVQRLVREPNFKPWDLFTKIYVERARRDLQIPTLDTFFKKIRDGVSNWKVDKSFILALVTALIYDVYSVLISMAYPFRNAYHILSYTSDSAPQQDEVFHNSLQSFCFACYAASLLLLVLTAPFAYRYIAFLLQTQFLKVRNYESNPRYASFTASNVRRWIIKHHTPPHVSALRASIPNDVIPYDVVGVVAEFLRPHQVDTSQLSRDEVEEMKKKDD